MEIHSLLISNLTPKKHMKIQGSFLKFPQKQSSAHKIAMFTPSPLICYFLHFNRWWVDITNQSQIRVLIAKIVV